MLRKNSTFAVVNAPCLGMLYVLYGRKCQLKVECHDNPKSESLSSTTQPTRAVARVSALTRRLVASAGPFLKSL